MNDSPTHVPDPWSALRAHTAARIALGRAGASLPTAAVLDFAIAHAEARDAVHSALDAESLRGDLTPLGLAIALLSTRAADRQTYLHGPDLGRQLDDSSHAALALLKTGETDIVFIIGDGLSAPAAQRQATPVLAALLPMLKEGAFRIGPICIVRQARVAVQDEIGAALGAKVAVILIGERPGLGAADSLGAYFVFNPKPGRTDAERNCISNIRPGGLSAAAAAHTLYYLLIESLRRQISGVHLKDERGTAELYDRDTPRLASATTPSQAIPQRDLGGKFK